jgi:membrane-bound metal-dependent hydrolase YbcI (DUF457 family)
MQMLSSINVLEEILYHFIVGSCVAYLCINKKISSRKDSILLLLIGGFAGLFPDIPKELLNDNFCHSIWVAPIIGLVFALVTRIFNSEIKLNNLCFSMTSAVIVGHLFMDYLDNGLPIFYPIKKEYSLDLVQKGDIFIGGILLIAVFIGFALYRKMNIILLVGIIIVSSYLGLRAFSKMEVHQKLVETYKSPNIKISITPQGAFSEYQWFYLASSDTSSITGAASFFNGLHEVTNNSK